MLTVVFYEFCVSFIKQGADHCIHGIKALAVGLVSLSITLFHGVEASVWAFTLLFLGAVTSRQTVALTGMLNASTAARSKSSATVRRRSNRKEYRFCNFRAYSKCQT